MPLIRSLITDGAFRKVVETLTLGTNGDFASGDFTGWTETDAASNVSVTSGKGQCTGNGTWGANGFVHATAIDFSTGNKFVEFEVTLTSVVAGKRASVGVSTSGTLHGLGAGVYVVSFIQGLIQIWQDWPNDQYNWDGAGYAVDTAYTMRLYFIENGFRVTILGGGYATETEVGFITDNAVVTESSMYVHFQAETDTMVMKIDNFKTGTLTLSDVPMFLTDTTALTVGGIKKGAITVNTTATLAGGLTFGATYDNCNVYIERLKISDDSQIAVLLDITTADYVADVETTWTALNGGTPITFAPNTVRGEYIQITIDSGTPGMETTIWRHYYDVVAVAAAGGGGGRVGWGGD